MFLVRNRRESMKETVSFVYRTNLPAGGSDEVVSLLQCFSWGDTSFTLVSKWEVMGLLGKRRPCSSSNSVCVFREAVIALDDDCYIAL